MKCMNLTRHSPVLFGALFVCLCAALPASGAKGAYFMYIGTYTGEKSKGIYAFRFDAGNGKSEPLGLVAETPSPSFVAIHPSRRYLYAVNEISNYQGQRSGAVVAYAIDPKTGKLTFLNQVSSRGAAPCHLVVDKTGKSLLVANYSGGSVAAFGIHADGSLSESSSFVQHAGSGPDARRQEGPHAHSINISRDNRFAVAADLGLDEVLVYRLDAAKASLAANDPPFTKVPPGGGPRHFAFHPTGKYGYVINEMGSTITAMTYDAKRGIFTVAQTISTLPKDFSGVNHTAEVQVHPSGKFVYGSNRGHNSIAVFTVDQARGTLTPVEQVLTQGKTPRNFAIDPTGSYLLAANQDSDNIVVFRIDQKTGKLSPTGEVLEVGRPVCIKFMAIQ